MRPFLPALALCLAAASVATAADLSPAAAPPLMNIAPPADAPAQGRWNGFTLGVLGAGYYARNQAEAISWFPPSLATAPIPNAYNFKTSGGSFGLQVGYMQQYGGVVLGAGADYSALFSNKATQSASGDYFGTPYTTAESQNLRALGTVRGRIGFSPTADSLLYATGGMAFGNVNSSTNLTFGTGQAYLGSRTQTLIGWTGGVGLEYALGPKWSLNAEGLYYDLGHAHVVGFSNSPPAPGFDAPESNASFEFKGYTLRLGLNYALDDGQSALASVGAGAPDLNGALSVTTGVRAAMSTGGAKLNLYDSTGSTLISRLTYTKAQAPGAEVYSRIEMPGSGFFLSGYAGLGKFNSGNLQDEDLPPLTIPYSSTNSPQSDGHLGYASVDAGYYVYDNGQFRLGGLVGLHYLDETFNAFGCTQTQTNSICAPGQVGPSNLTISDEGVWTSVRVGLAGEAKFGALTLRGDAAWLPHMSLSETNNHWLREPYDFSGPIPASATGSNGYQVEGEATYALSKNFAIGAGARYWSMNAKGTVNFQYVTNGGGPQVATFSSNRLQGFVESAYKF